MTLPFYPIPDLCWCGCNEITWNGYKYIKYHHRRRKHHSEETRKKQSFEGKKRIGKLNNRYGCHLTEQHKKILHDSNFGNKNHGWQGGKSFLPYCKDFNKQRKEKVRKRDNYQCQMPGCLCNQLENLILYKCVLNVHHIHYDKENCDPDLIALCTACNSRVNFNRDYWEGYFMKNLKERNLLEAKNE